MKTINWVNSASAMLFVLIVSSCNSPSGGGSSAQTAHNQWAGTFQAYVNGTLKDGGINIQYETATTGEFEIDDTNGPLGGSKHMSYTLSGNTATVTSTQCAGDSLVIHHDTQTGHATFDGSLCGTNITGGTAQMASN